MKSLILRHGEVVAVLLAISVCATLAIAQNFSPWSAAVNVGPPINTPFRDGCPFIAKNGLDLYFRSDRPGGEGGQDIYVSHRDTIEDPWETPINLGPEINTPFHELCSFVTIDGHWLYFVSTRPDGYGGMDLWVSHRKDKRNDVGWETPKNLGPNVNSAGSEMGPSIFADESAGQTVLYFSRNPGVTGGWDIYASPMVSDDKYTFGPASPVVELNTTYHDAQAFVRRKDGLEVILRSNRPGTVGGQDLWSATRATTLAPWSPPVNLGPLVNSESNDARPSLSWDGTELYFWSNRPGGEGMTDEYKATRIKNPK